jgi:hypothetical protein
LELEKGKLFGEWRKRSNYKINIKTEISENPFVVRTRYNICNKSREKIAAKYQILHLAANLSKKFTFRPVR